LICGKVSGVSCGMFTKSGVSKFETMVHSKHLRHIGKFVSYFMVLTPIGTTANACMTHCHTANVNNLGVFCHLYCICRTVNPGFLLCGENVKYMFEDFVLRKVFRYKKDAAFALFRILHSKKVSNIQGA
jgi:hypothetical protein